ncbi:hypothetical protein FJZ40_01970 [Candidatus Shapirobacteria bacterium]|nr:hypothetical protein [Candidatus Shapirobacteria bacterium]
MNSLAQAAYYTRTIIKLSAIGLVLFFVIKFSINLGIAYWKQKNPPPPPAPEIRFGNLPKIAFPAPSDKLPASLTYSLETIEGILPNLPTLGKVYFVPQPGPSLLASDRAKQKAGNLGFSGEPVLLTQTKYRFTSRAEPVATFELDIISGNFKLSYPYLSDPTLLQNPNVPQLSQAIAEARSYLAAAGALTDEIRDGRGEANYLKLDGQNLVPALSFSEAQFTSVNLFRKDLDTWPILSPNPKKSLIHFLFSGSGEQRRRIVEANFTYGPIDRQISSTYPLKTSAQAWQEIQAGQGFVANLGQNENGKITIRKAYLAYFDSEEPQKFLQPIFVFEGDRNFFAYITAVDSQYTD